MSISNGGPRLWKDIFKAIENRHTDPVGFARFFIGGITHETPLPLVAPTKLSLPIKQKLQKYLSPQYPLGDVFPKIYLTAREADCMAFLLQYYSNQQVATQLNLSVRTVEFYIKNMRQKLECHSKTHLIETIKKTDFMQYVDEIILRIQKN